MSEKKVQELLSNQRDPNYKTRLVHPVEQAAAEDPAIGDGTPLSAPYLPADAWDPQESPLPTNKVLAATLTGVVLYIVSQFTEVDKDLEQLVNVLSMILVAYFVRNKRTPGGYNLSTKT